MDCNWCASNDFEKLNRIIRNILITSEDLRQSFFNQHSESFIQIIWATEYRFVIETGNIIINNNISYHSIFHE
jgi:hypothetical protein